MTREHEYEVLKRHDVYVVRKVGSELYVHLSYERFFGKIVPCWGLVNKAELAHNFRFKWQAILRARKYERSDAYQAKRDREHEVRKSATEVRVWR